MEHLPAEDSGTGEQIILEEEIDEHYEPNDEGDDMGCSGHPECHCLQALTCAGGVAEIKEYAQWLGMDVEQEQVDIRILSAAQHGRDNH